MGTFYSCFSTACNPKGHVDFLISHFVVVSALRVVQFRGSRVRNFKSSLRYAVDRFLNCTPLGPITITNHHWYLVITINCWLFWEIFQSGRKWFLVWCGFLRETRAINQNLFCSKNMQRVPGMGERNAWGNLRGQVKICFAFDPEGLGEGGGKKKSPHVCYDLLLQLYAILNHLLSSSTISYSYYKNFFSKHDNLKYSVDMFTLWSLIACCRLWKVNEKEARKTRSLSTWSLCMF